MSSYYLHSAFTEAKNIMFQAQFGVLGIQRKYAMIPNLELLTVI